MKQTKKNLIKEYNLNGKVKKNGLVGKFLGYVKEKQKRGFANFTKERLREIASKAGKLAHKLGRAHQFTSEEAKKAGKLGGGRPRK